jgi:hypothetical protein
MTSHPLDAETALIAEWREWLQELRTIAADWRRWKHGVSYADELDRTADKLELLLSTRRGSGSDQEEKK